MSQSATATVIGNVWLYGRPRSASSIAWDTIRVKYGEGKRVGRKRYKRLKAAVREYD